MQLTLYLNEYLQAYKHYRMKRTQYLTCVKFVFAFKRMQTHHNFKTIREPKERSRELGGFLFPVSNLIYNECNCTIKPESWPLCHEFNKSLNSFEWRIGNAHWKRYRTFQLNQILTLQQFQIYPAVTEVKISSDFEMA